MRWPHSLAHRHGSALVVVLLALAVLVTAGLSLEAVRSTRSARATAEGVLRDYAAIAAVQFARESQVLIDGHIASGLTAARQRGDGHLTNHPAVRDRECDCAPPPSTRTIFAIARHGVVFLEGDALSAELVRELASNIPDTRPTGRPMTRLIDDDRLLVTSWGRRAAEPVVIGFVAGRELLDRVFERVVSDSNLLPSTLVHGMKTRDFLTVRVSRSDARTLYQTDDGSSLYMGEAGLGPHFSELRVAAAIKPDRASALLIDGLPSERLTLIVGLLVLAAGLMTAAAIQLRRDIRFARQRADFVSGVSHELRTPLAQIRLYGETLQLGRVRSSDESRRAADIIVQESRRLSQMVDNVLLFSRAGRGLVTAERERVDVADIVEKTVDAFRPQALSRQAAIEVDTSQASVELLVDPNALRQVLLNLLDNAVKYGPRGQTIVVRARAAGTTLRIEVDDQGQGVPASDVQRIWEPFWRASGSAEGGTGLGLAIVHELATRHGGSAEVERAPGGGARFVVTVEAAVPA